MFSTLWPIGDKSAYEWGTSLDCGDSQSFHLLHWCFVLHKRIELESISKGRDTEKYVSILTSSWEKGMGALVALRVLVKDKEYKNLNS